MATYPLTFRTQANYAPSADKFDAWCARFSGPNDRYLAITTRKETGHVRAGHPRVRRRSRRRVKSFSRISPTRPVTSNGLLPTGQCGQQRPPVLALPVRDRDEREKLAAAG